MVSQFPLVKSLALFHLTCLFRGYDWSRHPQGCFPVHPCSLTPPSSFATQGERPLDSTLYGATGKLATGVEPATGRLQSGCSTN